MLDHTVKTLIGEQRERLCETYANKVILVVNTASKCAFTNQYEGLEKLYDEYRARGFVVLGFPSNDFGNQEPGTEAQIEAFCRLTYGVEFPMFTKTRVAKGEADPLYQGLAKAANGDYPQWNFHKYLIDRSGQLIGSFPSRTDPYDPQLVSAIEQAL
ncbi:MAG: glutathione peroxidase [Thiotrichales bacterium]